MRFFIVFALVVLTAACGGESSDVTDAPRESDPTGVDWQLSSLSLDGDAVDLGGITPTIRFEASGDLGGSNGCNSYGGPYTLTSEGVLTIGSVFQTEIGCLDHAAVVETVFMRALARVDTLVLEDGALTLSASDGSAVLAFVEPPPVVDAPLIGSWRLDTIGDEVAVSSIVAGTDPTLEIGDAEIGGWSGCNDFGGALRWDADGTFVVGDIVATEVGCEPGIMTQERAIFDTLAAATRYEIEGDFLMITTDEGDRFLRFARAG